MNKAFITRAIELAMENVASGGGPFGALIVKDAVVIAQAANQVTALNDPTAHAEVLAIRLAGKALATFDLRGCELYSSCEPCPMCLGAIYWARIDRIYFGSSRAEAAAAGFDDALIYSELSRPAAERRIPAVQITGAETIDPFSAWKNKQDKVEY